VKQPQSALNLLDLDLNLNSKRRCNVSIALVDVVIVGADLRVTDPDGDLKLQLAVLESTTDLGHFEPIEGLPRERSMGRLHRFADGGVR